MKKRLLTLSIILLALIPAVTARVITVEIDSLKYEVDTETKQSKVATSNQNFGHVVIPETIVHEGVSYAVTSIGKGAFFWGNQLEAVTIPNTVTTIMESAFSLCQKLATVNIPNSVKEIQDRAFWCCYSMTSVTIPSSVTSVGEGIFAGCYGLTEIRVDADNAYFDSRNDCNAIIRKADNTLISGCKTTIIPSDVTAIANYAFYETNLSAIAIPNSVTSIGDFAFAYCPLTTIALPSSVTSIGRAAFWGDSKLTTYIVGWTTPIPFPEEFNWNTLLPSSTLYVPTGSKQSYEQAEVWKEFKDIVEMDEEQMASVSELKVSRMSETKVYDLQGRQVAQPRRGLYIRNGRKIIIR